jgi:phosphoenolpyruvate carboxylase
MTKFTKTFGEEKREQTIMLGFSDGTKDGGYLKANWKFMPPKKDYSKVSEENDVKVIFFDGRGGPPSSWCEKRTSSTQVKEKQ